MRVFLCIVLLSFFVPAPVWADNPVGQAVINTAKATMDRNNVPPEQQTTTLGKIKAYLALPANSLDSWVRIARALGVPMGTSFAGKGGSFPGAGTDLDYCIDLDVLYDYAGNLFVPALYLKDPSGYGYGSEVWYHAYGGIVHNTNNYEGAIKLGIHMRNAGVTVGRQIAPTHFAIVGTTSITVVASAPAYYDAGGTLRSARFESVSGQRNSGAWTSPSQGGPPLDWGCETSVCMGNWQNHWKDGGYDAPGQWDIPAQGVVIPSQIKDWAKNSRESTCPLTPEFIRQITQKAWENAASAASYDGVPPQRVEKEDVRNGGTQPTVKDTSTTGAIPDPSENPGTPTEAPTDTPSQEGPDWTDPGTAAPNPQSPTAQSIVDKAWDWGFPSISINLGSASCPTYTAQFYTYNLTLDSHCPFIEQNRAAISALMILLFTIAAGIIVLRA